ncbi:hypothetical protein SDC9_86796 [bioreactor metagenome]|uniref:Uncharacterized protein n=1 Tax=bioreactor metagenome TaxID=1076179 RepID=A0A644ZHF7_9ZZZZ
MTFLFEFETTPFLCCALFRVSLYESHEDLGHLGPGGVAQGVEGVSGPALHEPRADRPAHGGKSVAGDVRTVREGGEIGILSGAYIVALIDGVVIEDDGDLLSRDIPAGREGARAVSFHDALGGAPQNSLGVPRCVLHVAEGIDRAGCGRALQSVEHGREHPPRHGESRPEGGVRNAVE